MQKTFFELLKRASNQKWSTNDPEPKNFDEVLMSTKIAMQQAMIQLWNEYPFEFKKKEEFRQISAGEKILKAPLGQLTSLAYENGTELRLVTSEKRFDDKKGYPACYKVETSNYGDKIILYPEPAEKITIGFYYETMQMAQTKEGILKFNLENEDDVIAIEHPIFLDLFENALVLLTQVKLIEDAQDENYLPYIKAYEKALSILKNFASTKQNKRILI